MFRGRSNRYGSLAIALHWISAFSILGLLPLGIAAVMADDPAKKTMLLRLHIPLGVLVLLLTLARMGWSFVDTRPSAPAGEPRWRRCAARLTHLSLYAVVVMLCTSGITTVALSGVGPILFGGEYRSLPVFDDLTPFHGHRVAAMALVALLCAHVGGALYHQFIRKDRLLARMGLGRRSNLEGVES